MSSNVQALQPAGGLAILQQILDLIDALRKLSDPATTVDGLKQVVGALVQLGAALGIEQTWLDRVSQLLTDPELLAVATAVVQYIAALVGKSRSISQQIGGVA